MIEAESFKIVLKIQRRADGGVRIWSDDVPGLVLSNKDPQKVLDDIKPALEAILSEAMGCQITAHALHRFPHLAKPAAEPRRAVAKRREPVLPSFFSPRRKTLEYAALPCPG